MRWPWTRRGATGDREGKELAMQQLEVAKALEVSARQLALDHRAIQHANHFGPSVAAALREGRRRR